MFSLCALLACIVSYTASLSITSDSCKFILNYSFRFIKHIYSAELICCQVNYSDNLNLLSRWCQVYTGVWCPASVQEVCGSSSSTDNSFKTNIRMMMTIWWSDRRRTCDCSAVTLTLWSLFTCAVFLSDQRCRGTRSDKYSLYTHTHTLIQTAGLKRWCHCYHPGRHPEVSGFQSSAAPQNPLSISL